MIGRDIDNERIKGLLLFGASDSNSRLTAPPTNVVDISIPAIRTVTHRDPELHRDLNKALPNSLN